MPRDPEQHPRPVQPEHADRRKVAVVGGGVAGLVTAWELARAGVAVTLFEADTAFGGRIRAAEVAGVRLELGAEAFATRGGAVAELIGELGLSGQVVSPAPLGSWLVAAADGHATALPPAGTLGIPAAPLGATARRALGLCGAVRAAVEPWLSPRVGAGSETLAELVRSRLGSRVLDRLVRPVTLGVSAAAPEQIALSTLPELCSAYDRAGSLTGAARGLRDSAVAAGGAVAGLRGGMSRLVSGLVAACERAGVELRTGAPVERIAPEGSGIRIRVAPEELRFAAVVLALPEAETRRLLDTPHSGPVATPVEVVALVLDATHPAVAPLIAAPRGTGALVSGAGAPTELADAITAKALTHVTRKWPGIAGPDREVLRLSYGRAGAPPATAELDEAGVRALALRDAALILDAPIPEEALLGVGRQRWEMPERGDREAPTPPAGVSLIGDWQTGAGFAALVPAARNRARELASELLSGGSASAFPSPAPTEDFRAPAGSAGAEHTTERPVS